MATETKQRAGLQARRQAVHILGNVLDNKQSLSDALESPGLQNLEARDRAFAHAIAAVTLRHKGQIDHTLKQFLKRPLPAKSGIARHILTSAAAQLLFLDIAPHAAIDMAVRLANGDRKARPLKGLINAVLRRISEQGADIIKTQDAATLNTPKWLLQRWQKTYGNDTAHEIATAHLSEAALDITVKSDPEHWATQLGGKIVGAGSIRIENPGPVHKLAGFDEGQWWVQDIAASLPALLLGDVTGKTIFDLCAAPGGKTAQLASAGANVIAVDHAKQRLARLQENLSRLNLNATLVHSDIFNFKPDDKADMVLLDAPCSATGTIRRHPDIPYLKSTKMIAELAQLQAKLITHALGLLKPGGILIYCTCSLEPEEGEQQIKAALENHPVTRLPVQPDELGGLAEIINAHGDLRCLPHHTSNLDPVITGMDGFFAARLKYQP